jgi:two-component system response regulator HydG
MNVRSSLDRLPDATLLIDAGDLRIRDVAGAPGATFGYRPPELLARRADDLIPGCSADLLRAAVLGRHDPHPDTPLRVMVRHADGRERPADVRVADAGPGAFVATVRGVSERARAAERELVTVVCAAPVAIVTWAPDGRIVSFNPAAERLYGLTAAEAIGAPAAALAPDRERDAFDEAARHTLAGEPPPAREVVRLRRRAVAGAAGPGDLEIEVEESLFAIRDVARHVVGVGSFSRETTELVRLRRAAEILSGTERSAGDGPGEGAGGALREAYAAAAVAARDRSVTVLLLGETGVGKSRLARYLHAQSARAGAPFLEVNCAGLEPQLAESELFGHEKGAFTGAARAKRGLVEAAAGGTLFLDEVGELTPPVQAKLLTFLDERTFRRVGGTALLRADVRLLAATNADLEARVAAGAFRRDLYYRLRVLPITLPPLRDRPGDLPALVRSLLAELRPRVAHPPPARDVLDAFARYPWPGNLRELRNALERALLLADGGPLRLEHLPAEIRAPGPAAAGPRAPAGLATNEGDLSLDGAERRHVAWVLARAGGNHTAAAAALGISRSTLNRKLARWAALGPPFGDGADGAP